jgi:sugar lactone lactonase YvrE
VFGIIAFAAAPAMALTVPAGYYQGAIYFDNSSGITCTPSGDLYALRRETGGATDGLYKPGAWSGTRLTTFTAPFGLLAHQGSLWVTEDYNGDLFKVNTDGTGKTKHVDQFVGCPGDDDPCGMTVAPAGFSGANVNPGDIIVVDRGSTANQVQWWISTVDPTVPSPTTEQTLAANSGITFSGDLYDPWDAAASPDGSVYILEHKRTATAPSTPGLYKVDSAGNVSFFSTHTDMVTPNAVAVHPTTGKAYVADETAGKVFEVDPPPAQPASSSAACRWPTAATPRIPWPPPASSGHLTARPSMSAADRPTGSTPSPPIWRSSPRTSLPTWARASGSKPSRSQMPPVSPSTPTE